MAISLVINDLWAPSSKMIFPSIVTCGVLTMAMAVFNKQGSCRTGEFETDTVGVNSFVMVAVCPVALLSSFVFV